MNIFRNNLRLLEKDNDDRMSNIKDENKKAIRDIVRYLSSSSMSLFEVQVIRKDLIGMALQSDMENGALKDKIGVNEKTFCDAIIENGRNHKWLEHLIKFIVSFLQTYAIFYFMEFLLLYSSPVIYGIKVISISSMFIWQLLGRALTSVIRNKLSVSTIQYKSIFTGIPVVLAILSIKLMNSFDIAEVYIIMGNGWLIGSVLIMIALLASIIENIFWNCTSEKYSWKG